MILQTKRETWIDIAKGIGIISVLLGHNFEVLKPIIFSFHMPLFFILSGYTFKEEKPDLVSSFVKYFKNLIVPCLIARIIILVGNCIINDASFFQELMILIKSILWGNRSGTFLGIPFPSIGRIWFLIALFWTKICYSFILHYSNSKIRVPFLALMSLGSMLLGSCGIMLPQNLDMIFVCLLFMEIGHCMKKFKHEKMSRIMWFCLFSIWIYFSINQEIWMDMNKRQYPGFALCIVVALCGCICIFSFSKAIESFIICKPLVFFGKYSLILLVIHSIVPYFYQGDNLRQKIIDIIAECMMVILWVFLARKNHECKKKIVGIKCS